MTVFLKFLFERITDPLTLPISPVAEWIGLLIINKVVYTITFGVVGDLYSAGIIYGSTEGKIAHWVIRLICFFLVWAVVYFFIIAGVFVINNWRLIITGLLLLVGLWCLYLILRQKRKAAMSKSASL